MTLQPVTLTGHLVHLEPLSDHHIPDLLEAAHDERIWQYMFYGNLAEPEHMENFIANAILAVIYHLRSSIALLAKLLAAPVSEIFA